MHNQNRKNMIIIIDYGLGNSGSIKNMLARLGIESEISSDLGLISSAEKLILPGVGAFDVAMRNLTSSGLVNVLNDCVLHRKVPILGICLGMQVMSEKSEEGVLPGLGWFKAETVRFQFSHLEQAHLKIPHMGWSEIEYTIPLCSLLPCENS